MGKTTHPKNQTPHTSKHHTSKPHSTKQKHHTSKPHTSKQTHPISNQKLILKIIAIILVISLFIPLVISSISSKAINSKTPINTYDISFHPNYISGPESPVKSFDDSDNTLIDSTGDLQIVKVYANVYRATSSNRYTKIVPVSPLGIGLDTSSGVQHFYGNNLSRQVYITDEKNYNGYKLVAWQGSTDVEHSNNFNNRFVLENHGEYSADEWIELDVHSSSSTSSSSSNASHKDGYTIDYKFNHRTKTQFCYNPSDSSHSYNLQYNSSTGYLDVPSNIKTLYILYIKEMPAISTDGSVDNVSSSTSVGTYNTQQPNGLLGNQSQNSNITFSLNSLNIVKLYGTMDDKSYSVRHDATYVRENVTYNVRFDDEVNYNVKAYALVNEAPDKSYTSTKWCDKPSGTVLNNQSDIADHGFLDGFDKATSTYIAPVSGPKPLSYSYINESGSSVHPGDTVYFRDIAGASSSPSQPTTLYVLYLKSEDNSVNEDHDLIITESYITKRIKLSEAGVEIKDTAIKDYNFAIKHPGFEHMMRIHTDCDEPVKDNWPDWGGYFVNGYNNIVLYETKHNINYSAPASNGNTGYNNGILEGLSRLFINEVAPSMINPNNVLVGNKYPVKNRLSVNFTPTPFKSSYSYSSAHWKGTLDDYNIADYTIIINGLDLSLVVHRKDDVVTLAKWKNEQDSNNRAKMNEIYKMLGDNNIKISNQPQGLRKSNALKFNNNTNTGGYRYTTSYGFKVDTNKYSNFKRSFNVDQSYTHDGLTWGLDNNLSYDTAQDIEFKQGIKYYTYSGKSTLSSNPFTTSQTNTNTTSDSMQILDGTRLPGEGAVIFYPYIQMYYDGKVAWAKSAGANAKGIYVLSEHEREITPDSYVGVIINPVNDTGLNIVNTVDNNNTPGKLSIDSKQWSTHATANEKIGFRGCVLPGGAMFNVSIPSNSRQKAVVETMTPILEDKGLAQVNATTSQSISQIQSTISTDRTANLNEHNNLVDSVLTGFESLNIEQYVVNITDNQGIIAFPTKPVYETGRKAVVSIDDTSVDSKYMLREENDVIANKTSLTRTGNGNGNDNGAGSITGASNAADLDAHVVGDTEEYYYTFRTTVDGKIMCNNTIVIDAKRQKPNGDSDYSSLTGYAWRVAKATGIVEKLYYAVELGGGNDISNLADKSSQYWYNEAFDGITYVYRRTTIEIGFIDPYERSAILDPTLTPTQENKGDMLNRYYATQFATSTHSVVYGNEEGKIAEYKGNAVYLDTNKLKRLFTSDIFFIPNMTVQDLK